MEINVNYVPAKRVEQIVYTLDQAQTISTLSRTSIRRYINTGQLPTVMVGGRRMITRDALEQFVLGVRAARSGGDAA